MEHIRNTKINMKHLSLIFILIMVSQLTLAKNGGPLLMKNKKNLYQRILTLPDAMLYSQAEEIQRDAEPLPVFSIYYVYSRMKVNNIEWLKVSLGRYGNRMRMGWIREDKTLEWNQRLTLTFRDPIDNQDRVLLFKDKKSAEQLATSSNLKEYKRIYQAAVKGKKLVDSPVIAIQPSEHIDIRENFYLIPIHTYEDIFMNGSTARLLQVSSIPITEEDKFNTLIKTQSPTDTAPLPIQSNIASDAPYTAGITFVVDSTLSMQRFIDRTRQAVRTIFDDIKQADLLGNVSFGLVAYRDNISITPKVEYVTKQYVSLKQGKDPDVFMKQVAGLQATEWTTKNFIEDGFAGIHHAIEKMDWSPYAARYIVLITDASSRDAQDPLSSTGLKLAELKKLAHKKNIAIFVMHLLTPASKFNHEEARKQYTSLSEYPNIGSFYYGVPTGNTNELGKVIEKLSAQITTQVGQMKAGDNTKVINEARHEPPQLQGLKSKIDKLGYTLRMHYLQKQGEQAPDVFKAWIVDKDFNTPEHRTVDARVLLTRNQLSDLHSILKQVLNTARKGVMSPKNFLNDLKSLAATTSRNPDRMGGATSVTAGKGHSLAEMGFMREYIDGLPYTSNVLGISLDDWQRWPVKRQTEFLQNIRDKINYYQYLHDNVDLWVSLKGGSIDGDSVFPVLLTMLP